MRTLISIVILFALAIGLAVAARFNPGNVVLFYPPYRIDMSLNFFILLLALLYFVLQLVFGAIRTTRRMPARVAEYRRDKRERDGNKALREALKALFEGRFGHAEKAAERASKVPENAGVAALIGARAAHRIGQPERRDTWLARIEGDPAMRTARLMTSIDLAVDEHESEAALEAVRELGTEGTRHIHALRLALKANQQERNWAEVLRLVRVLDKRNALHPAAARRLRELAYDDLLASQRDPESLRLFWDAVPTADRLRSPIALQAANAFCDCGLQDQARNVIEKALEAEWDDRLVRAYARCAAAEGTQALLLQIERCEKWLQSRPNEPELELTLGALCLRQNLWGKAQRHLEAALAGATDSQTVRAAHLKLAQMHEALSQPEEAASHYRQCALGTIY